jgi:hypothetical protein
VRLASFSPSRKPLSRARNQALSSRIQAAEEAQEGFLGVSKKKFKNTC